MNARNTKQLFYDRGVLIDVLRRGVQRHELADNSPIDAPADCILTQLYGVMLCWCMADKTFSMRHWGKLFFDVQLCPLLAPYIMAGTK